MKQSKKNIIRNYLKKISSGKIQKRLGYERNTKLLIIHADDMGLSESENIASIDAIENGMVNSGSVMVTCKGFPEIVKYSKSHPQADIGVHLTLLSEWSSYKWGPVLETNSVSSLVNSNGDFLETKEQLLRSFDPDELELEYSAQIKLALDSGIDLTHIDSHMFTAFSNRTILEKYISLGKLYRLPVLLTYNLPILSWFLRNRIVVDNLYYAKPSDFEIGLDKFYSGVLRSLEPGLNLIILHPALNDREMQDIAQGNSNFGPEWRQADYDFFRSTECRQLIKDYNIKLITWREIRDKLIRKS